MKNFLAIMMAGAALAGANVRADADFTGNPVADGWTLRGNSLTLGTYIRNLGGADFNFDVYSHSFTLASDSELLDGFFWEPGDLVIGLGGVHKSGFVDEIRVVGKFGSADSQFGPSSYVGSPGDGIGDFSDGDGGTGSVLVGYRYKFFGNLLDETGFPGQNGGVVGPDLIQYYDGFAPVNIDITYGYARGIFGKDGQNRDVLQSFEILLNLTALADPDRDLVSNTGFSPIPVVNGRSDLAIQQGINPFYTDAFSVPEPTTALLVALSLTGAAVALRRR